jgi:hypothetical protein
MKIFAVWSAQMSTSRSEQPPSKEKLRPGIWIGAVWFPLSGKPSRWDRFWVWFCNGWKYEERA